MPIILAPLNGRIEYKLERKDWNTSTQTKSLLATTRSIEVSKHSADLISAVR
jgi:hypothetical protein